LDAAGTTGNLIQSQVHKGLFTADGRFVGADMVARDVGRQVAHWELRNLIQPMASADPRLLVSDDDGAENVSDFVAQLRQLAVPVARAAGPTSVVLLVPIGWQLSEALGLAFLGGRAVPPDDWGLSEGATNGFAGLFESVGAYHFPQIPPDVLYVVDLSRYASAQSWESSDETEVTVTVLSEHEARSRAERDLGKDKVGEDEIVRRWRETALITVDPGLRIDGKRDSAALTAIRLPASLRRN
jgi:hypothetical protein